VLYTVCEPPEYTFGVFEIIGLIVLQVLLLALGLALGGICALFVLFAIRGVRDTRRRRVALMTALIFPLVAVLYLEAGVVFRDVARYTQGKDSFLDGVLHYPLGNGYRLVFFSKATLEDSWIDDPRGESLPVHAIYGLQVAGDFTFMHAYRVPEPRTVPTVAVNYGQAQPAGIASPNIYLELNTKTHERSEYSSLEDLSRAAASRNTPLRLAPLDDFHEKAISAAAPGWLFWGPLGMPLLIAGAWLLRGLHRLWRRDDPR
jgi:hypothetical protein